MLYIITFGAKMETFISPNAPPEPATLEHTNYEAGRPIRPAGKEDKWKPRTLVVVVETSVQPKTHA